MARVTYVDTAHSATVNPTKVDANSVGDGSTQNRVVKKLIVGKPAAALNVILYHNDNAYFGATTNIAFKYTFPTFGAGTPATDVFDFTSPEGAASSDAPNGLILYEGGSISTSAACQLTVLWESPEA